MKQKIKLTDQILRLYVGRFFSNGENKVEIVGNIRLGLDSSWGIEQMMPHLRKLSSITENEALELYDIVYGGKFEPKYFARSKQPGIMCETVLEWGQSLQHVLDSGYFAATPAEFLYLTSKGFDLFGLINAGLAKEVSE